MEHRAEGRSGKERERRLLICIAALETVHSQSPESTAVFLVFLAQIICMNVSIYFLDMHLPELIVSRPIEPLIAVTA